MKIITLVEYKDKRKTIPKRSILKLLGKYQDKLLAFTEDWFMGEYNWNEIELVKENLKLSTIF